ncbi:MAG: alpha-ribazole phosphatase [Thermotaleaceae bacterium]
MEIILVRHGETELNHQKKYCGWKDPSLTETGICQAEIVRDKLKAENLQAIYCSDLKRTFETAQIINEYHQLGIVPMKGLREMNFGLLDGLSYAEIQKKYPTEAQLWEKDWIDFVLPQGESFRSMYERVNETVREIYKESKKDKILFVSHSGCIRAILAHWIGGTMKDYWKYKIEHCGITRIEISDDYSILSALNQ